MAFAARPALLDSGLKPVDRSLETHWVKPGAATAVSLAFTRVVGGRIRDRARKAKREDDPQALAEQ